ncbi:uncharacterized protein OCT59_008474 [Rhizophagus irregularis]|uniref:uncharacterized protein n=1 Tax=Rhizophagus irregularis TaxID=588596 RepID=UPI00332DBFE7|nr:hypothetical protein OCT59_008474 [Rhizophagus irregularis]
MQLKINNENDVVFEWIPYKQFNKIRETGKNDSITVYSAIWKDGPLHKEYSWRNYKRYSIKEVALIYLHNLQESVDSLINEAKRYSTDKDAFQVLYGISQDPDTGDYILVQNNLINLVNWVSGNEKIDYFIRERQLKINDYNDIVLEWIPYNQFNEIKETGKNDSITVYSAIWKDGPLHKEYSWRNYYKRGSNKEVALIYLHNLQEESIDSLINEAKRYSTDEDAFQVLYGISQNPDTGDYIFVQNNLINLVNWVSGNEKIDYFIRERQLKINNYDDIVLEWVPYNQFNEIKETGKNGLITVYSAIWKDGPLHKEYSWRNYYKRGSNKEVALIYLHNLQESIDSLINEAKRYSTIEDAFQVLYGISQNPDTGDYIFVQNNFINLVNWNMLEWIPYDQFNKIEEAGKNGFITVYSAIWINGPLCYKKHNKNYNRGLNERVALKYLHNSQESIDSLINEAKRYSIDKGAFQALYGISQNPDTGDYILVQNNLINLVNWVSGNEKIDYFIRERQLKINNYDDIVLEWIPYNQFNEIKETGKNGLITVYSAIWKNGPLFYNKQYTKYTRDLYKKIALKCLHNTQKSIDSLINEAKKYPIKYKAFQVLYGISQNPDTGDFILVLTWTSGNEKIDDFIQERQLNIISYSDIVLEWIPYNQFNEIKETGKNGLITVYSAIWKDGPLHKEYIRSNYTRDSNKKVALKYLHNLQESIDSLINEARKYPTVHRELLQVLYGISQNLNTGDYFLILNWTSGNEKIDYFIQEMQLKINDYDDIVLEWIPYSQFNEIKETSKNGLIKVYSAIWKDGPLYKKNRQSYYTRDLNKVVALKYLNNSQNSIESLINETRKYTTKYKAFQALYGISQNPDTEDYILVLMWTSGNGKIDYFIQEMQLKINGHGYDDIVFEWIPYSQFNDIKEIGKGGFSTVYSAEWKNGPLEYDVNEDIYIRNPNRVIALKCLCNSQNITDKFLNEVKKYSISKSSNILNIYGISQNPDTKEYIMVLQYAEEGNFNHWINKNYEYFNWKDKISVLLNIVNGLKEIHQRNLVHHDFHTGNILFLNFISYFSNCVLISDMGLCGEVDSLDETKIYKVMPYMAPEVLRGKPYTQAADIYSFDKNNRPDIFEIDKLITSFYELYVENFVIVGNEEIVIQFEEAEEYRKANLTSIENYQTATHPQAIYTSRLLNPITKDLPKNDDDYNSQSLDHCALPISFK